MYTGITQGLFEVIFVEKQEGLTSYKVRLSASLAGGLKPGDSVAIDGVCQTVVEIEKSDVTFQAIRETLEKTTLDRLHIGRWVSVERSARLGDENGGHELAGHIFEEGTILKRCESENNVMLEIQCSEEALKAIFEKGFIALDGSSLTIGAVDTNKKSFEVHLIPETLRLTNFSKKQIGDKVNIELDSKAVIISKNFERYLLPLQKKLEVLEEKVASMKQAYR